MCGFSGIFSRLNGSNTDENLLTAMCDTLKHRGPNDKGIWFDAEAGIGLAHTRLAVVDLSPAGHQPMIAPSGRYVIAFNGEIYNHLQLRNELKQVHWRGHSDTETLLAGFDAWGIEETIKRTVGMFAFALWDKQSQILTLGRDRVGEKPLYYGWHGSVFLFGSELKALKVHPEFRKELNSEALSLFLRYNYIPTPYSIYKNTHKLLPGCLLQVSLKDADPVIQTYWSAADIAVKGSNHPFRGDEVEAVNELERTLSESIRQQMVADVPLGAFLSGGVDSSTVVSLMQAQSSQPVHTFSIGFHEKKYNEAEYAKAVAMHLGTHHTELYITNKDALDVIPKLSTLYDEPFSDSSQIPTFLISALAKQDVTVALTGDAGDELFCGYNRYKFTDKLWRKIRQVPMPLRKGVSKIIKGVPCDFWDRLGALIPFVEGGDTIGAKLHKGANALTSTTIEKLYRDIVSHHNNPCSLLVMDVKEPKMLSDQYANVFSGLGDINRMMTMDLLSYLPDDILVKVDRAAMGVSLETRVPFLDHRLIEFAWSLPVAMNFKDGQTKWSLRQVLDRYVPRHLIERPKMGFGVPLNEWLRGPLKNWAETLLDENRLVKEGIFNHQLISLIWQEHVRGKGNWSALLWNILMFQAWWEIQ
ncbi:MAG: asparagine synthase (glutamine-hydrolyzing) [Legionellales bacterium]